MPTFAELSHAFLQEELRESPVSATQLGAEGFDHLLDDLSESGYDRRQRANQTWLDQLDAVPEAELTFEERIDRDLIRATLHGRQVMADWQMWRRQPDTYLNPGLNGVFSLFLHRLHSEEHIVEAASARLREIPRNLQEGRKNLSPELTPPLYIDRALNQARAGARYARELLPAEVTDPALRGKLAEAGAVAAEALEEYATYLGRLRERASGDWAIGEERYSALLQQKERLTYNARSLRERGQQEWDKTAAELLEIGREISGSDDWAAVLESLNDDHPSSPEDMRQQYEACTLRARQFLIDHELVTMPEGESCAVDPSPPFQRPVLAVASYIPPPAFTNLMRGHFFVPFPPDDASPEDIEKRLAGNSIHSIPTTSVHEAYPGHHWHLTMRKAHPSLVRRSYGTAYMSEGWALYSERMMREQGFYTDPRQLMAHLEATLFRAARIVVDTSLHMGEMTYEEAVTFMSTKANLPEPVSRAEVTRYCAWPTQASSYLTGCLEILRIRQAYFDQVGKSDTETLKTFHDRLARSGSLPLGLAEEVVLARDAT